MHQLKQFFQRLSALLQRHATIVATVLLAFIYIPASYHYGFTSTSFDDTAHLLRVIVIAMVAVAICLRAYPASKVLAGAMLVAVPAAAVLVAALMQTDPSYADQLAVENYLIENLSFILLLVGSVCLLLAAFRSWWRRQWVAGLAALLVSLVFLVIAMEEVSWLQHVLGYETHPYLLEVNLQQEMNLHNLDTHLSERIYYVGGFVVLTLLPFLREPFVRLLQAIRLPSLAVLLPPGWMALAFMLTNAFIHDFHFDLLVYTITTIGSLAVLASLMVAAYLQRQWVRLVYCAIVLVLFLYLTNFFISTDFTSLDVRNWVGVEYREFFIAWGIAAYGLAVHYNLAAFRTTKPQTTNGRRRKARK